MILAATLSGTSPTVVHRGQLMQIAATVGTSNGCFAHVDWADSSGVDLGTKYPDAHRHVAWSYRIPLKAPLGPAQWSIRCGTGIYNYSGNWLIVQAGVTVGPRPPRPVVSKQGFSQRADAFGTGSSVSYGLLIRNPALKKDAKSVTVTISFVAASGDLIGRKTMTVARIGAGETFALGGSTGLGTQADVKKLTASIRVGSYAKAASMPRPRVTSARIVGNDADPGFVGEVDGQVANDTSQHALARAFVSIVVLDAGGRIVGGGTGTLSGPVASGATGTFAAKVGFAAIPTPGAVRPVVSVVPTYR
jgi:hypothetical protein